MVSGGFRFSPFLLDPDDRRLSRDGAPVELNARYLDALTLLVREQGKLVSKDRFLDEVWRGVPVTDEALTQCIRTLRRQLGDDATAPRFIETVPKHGYRFIAPVVSLAVGPADGIGSDHDRTAAMRPGTEFAPQIGELKTANRPRWQRTLLIVGAGTVGGGLAGFVGGLFYGFAGAAQPLQAGMGAASVLLVLLCLTILAALVGALGVALGIALAGLMSRPFGPWSMIGGAVGGMLVGAIAKLLGLDAFNLLLGRSPGDITGGMEGALLGAAVGVGAWLASLGRRPFSLRRSAAGAGLAGATAGLLIPLLGGRMMGGSLDLLARSFEGSRLRLDQIGALVGEHGFGTISQLLTGALEGLLFAACIVGAMVIAQRNLDADR